MRMAQMRMRTALLAVSLGIGGSLWTGGAQGQSESRDKTPSPLAAAPVPTAEHLVRYLRDNTIRISALRCTNVSIDFKVGHQVVGLGGQFLYQRSEGLRFEGKVIGQRAFDFGYNRQQAWYWISKNDPPYLFWFTRKELASGKSRWSLPCPPDWVAEVLGVAEWDADKPRKVVARAKTLELIEPITTPQGQLVSKVTVFAREASPIQVRQHLLRDEKGKVICEAVIGKVREDAKEGARLVEDVKFMFPGQHLEARLQFHDVKIIEPLEKERAERVFSPDDLDVERFPPLARSKPVTDIQIELTEEQTVLRHGEDMLKLTGRLDRPLAIQLMQDQLRSWLGKEKQAGLCVSCSSLAEYASVKLVVDACREVGVRNIEVRTTEK